MTAAAPSQKPSVTVVTCIESGLLENEVPLMVATLRKFGGPFADCPVIAASPRTVGLPLQKSTRVALDKLGVKIVERDLRHRYRWWGFINKPTSMVLAAPHIQTKHALWLDGDTLVASPPDVFGMHDEIDVMASVEEHGPASTGPDSPFDSFWARLAQVVETPLDKVPWVTKPFSKTRVRIYFNAGIFRCSLHSGFIDAYIKTVEQVLDAKIVPKPDPNIFLLEQLAFGMTIARLGLNFMEIDEIYNFPTEESFEQFCPVSKYKDVKIFHYHRSLRGSYRPKFLAQLRSTHPELADMVESQVSHAPTGLAKAQIIPRRLLYEIRKRRQIRFGDQCTRV